ncbi:MAG: 30S ribosomal protein S15 [Enterobacteriaceae bacterium PSpicST2]|nr:MAG: 30S ribosomal protein S15 [Enterobacteriaceae bacterium PSpicST2]WMC19073.1 MAG: 30S ribosomal protein S15 [Enterobacteriaceae bacterium PSpicST1]
MNIIKNIDVTEHQINKINKKIEKLKNHFLINKNDKHSRIGLLKKIINRKKILKYLKYNNFKKYKTIKNKYFNK